MGAREFGRLVFQARTARKLSRDRVAFLVGDLPGGEKNLTGKAVARIEEGARRLDTFVVGRLIDVLGLDPLPAWEAAGLWPPDLSADDLSELRAARGKAAQRVAHEGAAASASPFTADQRGANMATLITSARGRLPRVA